MNKKFNHNNIAYEARTNANNDVIQIGIFTNGDRCPYLLELDSDALADSQSEAATFEMSIEKLVEFSIEGFKSSHSRVSRRG